MNMPGFTAEASLYEIGRNYRQISVGLRGNDALVGPAILSGSRICCCGNQCTTCDNRNPFCCCDEGIPLCSPRPCIR